MERGRRNIMNNTKITHDVRLTDLERARFVELEKTVHMAIRSFLILGDALREIRDSRLYREKHPTFEDYCQDQFQFTRHRAFQLIEAARCGNRLLTIVNTEPPSNEGQVRPLVKVSEEIAAEAWRRASLAKQRPITGKIVSEALRQVLGRAPLVPQSNGVFDRLLQATSAVNFEVSSRGYSELTPREVSAIWLIQETISRIVTRAQLSSLFPPRLEGMATGAENQNDNP